MNEKKAFQLIDTLSYELEKRIKLRKEKLDLFITSYFSGNHLLLEDMPGVGKTTLAKTLAYSIAWKEDKEIQSFSRIQFTPDLIPYDIIGTEIYNKEKSVFEFKKGPVFSRIVLADEMNRGNPKIQSALLEAMGETQVTVFGKTYRLPDIFFVIATQNHFEREGVFPLTLSMLDRFGMSLSLGYPDKKDEKEILQRFLIDFDQSLCNQTINQEELHEIKIRVKAVHASDEIIDMIAQIGESTRKSNRLRHGLSPRALLHLLSATKSYAFCIGKRIYAIDDDVKKVFESIVKHRIQENEIPELMQIFEESLIAKV